MQELSIGPLTLIGEVLGGHVHCKVLGAGMPGHRPLCGQITVTIAEWSSLQTMVTVLGLEAAITKQRDAAWGELERLMPIRSVLGDWDWRTIVADGCVEDVALEAAAQALAKVEADVAKEREGG